MTVEWENFILFRELIDLLIIIKNATVRNVNFGRCGNHAAAFTAAICRPKST